MNRRESSEYGVLDAGAKIILIFAVLLTMISSGGCGKKGPPVPPDMPPLPKIDVLKSDLSGNRLVLSWWVPEDETLSEPDGFYVYRSKTSTGEDCADCPFIFQKTDDISARKGFFRERAKQMTYGETLEKGFVYRYKVMAYTDGGLSGEWSDVAEVSY